MYLGRQGTGALSSGGLLILSYVGSVTLLSSYLLFEFGWLKMLYDVLSWILGIASRPYSCMFT